MQIISSESLILEHLMKKTFYNYEERLERGRQVRLPGYLVLKSQSWYSSLVKIGNRWLPV